MCVTFTLVLFPAPWFELKQFARYNNSRQEEQAGETSIHSTTLPLLSKPSNMFGVGTTTDQIRMLKKNVSVLGTSQQIVILVKMLTKATRDMNNNERGHPPMKLTRQCSQGD